MAAAVAVSVLATLAAIPAVAQNAETNVAKDAAGQMSPAQKKAFENVIRDYILKNPEVILESIQGLRERQERAERERAAANLARLRGGLLNDPATPVGGNPKGDVTIVEFFDYRCSYCKKVFPDVMEVLRTDRNVRYVFKEFPILGPESVTATRASLAVWLTRPDRYFAFHQALMKASGALPEPKVIGLAIDAGIDGKKLRAAMADPRIDTIIADTHALAQALNINGTPAFVVGDHIIRGAIDKAQIRKLIAVARGS